MRALYRSPNRGFGKLTEKSRRPAKVVAILQRNPTEGEVVKQELFSNMGRLDLTFSG